MKQLLNILTFIFISVSVFGQTDSLIIGEYTFVEQKGIHVEPGMSIGDLHVTSYISHVDTTITYLLLLDTNHNAILQMDTTLGHNTFWIFPEYKWIGQWEVENDTLTLSFTQQSTLYPFSISGEEPIPTIEKLSGPILQKYQIQIYKNKICGLILEGEYGLRYSKND